MPPKPLKSDARRRRREERRRAVRRRRFAVLGVVVFVPLGVAALTVGGGSSAAARRAGPAVASASGTVTIAATGDITLGTTPVLPPDGARSLFAGVRSRLEGDLVLGNLETALTEVTASKCGAGSTSCFSFRAPPSYARRLREAGFTMLNLANNHAYDFGAAGQAQTVAALDAASLAHTGRPGEIAYERVGRLRVAVVGFAPYKWAQSLLDLAAARRIVRRAAASADVVVATMHAGAEGHGAMRVPRSMEIFLGEQRGNCRAFAHAVVDAGADLVVGHGPHVLRGMEWYRGRLIAYSLGNFSAYRNFALSGSSAVSGILRVTLRGDGGWSAGRLVPVRLEGTGTPRLDPSAAALSAVRSLSRADFGARGARVAADGTLSPPQ